MSKIFKFHNDVDTDQIIASQYLLLPNIEEMKGYTFESLDENFAKDVQAGDIIVAGENFGCGSSREQAPSVLKALGVKAVVAKSFARIFYRNAINIGLPILEHPTLPDECNKGENLSFDLATGFIKNNTTGKEYQCEKFPVEIQKLVNAGGLIQYTKEKLK